ncbi:hypothetical protein M2158_009578 [Streptomyces sp. SAI-144]|nr:hypothetical protein [Streptomyces sp. SAI-144]
MGDGEQYAQHPGPHPEGRVHGVHERVGAQPEGDADEHGREDPPAPGAAAASGPKTLSHWPAPAAAATIGGLFGTPVSLFVAAVLVASPAILALLRIASLPAWLLVTGRPQMQVHEDGTPVRRPMLIA